MVHRHGFWTSLETMVSFYGQHPIAHSYVSAWHQISVKTYLFIGRHTSVAYACVEQQIWMMSHGQYKQDVSEIWFLRRASEQYGTPLMTSFSCRTERACLSRTWRLTGEKVQDPHPALFPGCRPLDRVQKRGRKLFLSGSEFGSGSTFLFPPVLSTTLFRSVFHRSAMWKILEHIAVKVMDGSPVRNGVGGDGKKSASAPSFTRGCVQRRLRRWDYSWSLAEDQTVGMRSRLSPWFKFHCAYAPHSSFVWLWAASHSC